MFEDYLQDAYEFFNIAQSASKNHDEREARRYYRASVFCAANAIEAFVNYVADSFAQSKSMEQHKIAFLNDKVLIFSVKEGRTIEKDEYHRLDEKLKVLVRQFAPDYDFNSTAWSYLMQFKDLRDSLVHPRQVEDERSVTDYAKALRNGMTGIVETMNNVSLVIFNKPLRKQLLDLIPE